MVGWELWLHCRSHRRHLSRRRRGLRSSLRRFVRNHLRLLLLLLLEVHLLLLLLLSLGLLLEQHLLLRLSLSVGLCLGLCLGLSLSLGLSSSRGFGVGRCGCGGWFFHCRRRGSFLGHNGGDGGCFFDLLDPGLLGRRRAVRFWSWLLHCWHFYWCWS